VTVAAILWQAEPGGGFRIIDALPLVAIFVVFYFLLFLPNQRRQKKQQEMLQSLKNGDRVITSGGVHGTIVGLRDDYVVLRVPPDQLRIEVLRSSVSAVESPKE